MDRRSLLKMFGVAAAAAAVFHPVGGDALPVVPQGGLAPVTTDNGIATDAEIEGAVPEKAYWVYRRRFYRRRRFYYRPRYRYFRRRYIYRRRWWW